MGNGISLCVRESSSLLELLYGIGTCLSLTAFLHGAWHSKVLAVSEMATSSNFPSFHGKLHAFRARPLCYGCISTQQPTIGAKTLWFKGTCHLHTGPFQPSTYAHAFAQATPSPVLALQETVYYYYTLDNLITKFLNVGH